MNNYKMSCWELLEIEPTTDRDIIKRAYAKQAKKYHPEDNPNEFMELKDAYIAALTYARNTLPFDNQQVIETTTYENDDYPADINKNEEDNIDALILYVPSEDNDYRGNSYELKPVLFAKLKEILHENDSDKLNYFFCTDTVVNMLQRDPEFKYQIEELLSNSQNETVGSVNMENAIQSQIDKLCPPNQTMSENGRSMGGIDTTIKFIGGVIITFVVLGLIAGGLNNSNEYTTTSTSDLPSDKYFNSIYEDNQRVDEDEKETKPLDSSTILFLQLEENRNYLNGFDVIIMNTESSFETPTYSLIDESGNAIFEETFDNITFTKTPFLLLEKHSTTYIFNCQTRSLFMTLPTSNVVQGFITYEDNPKTKYVLVKTFETWKIVNFDNTILYTFDSTLDDIFHKAKPLVITIKDGKTTIK